MDGWSGVGYLENTKDRVWENMYQGEYYTSVRKCVLVHVQGVEQYVQGVLVTKNGCLVSRCGRVSQI